jgi:hypothetical protein
MVYVRGLKSKRLDAAVDGRSRLYVAVAQRTVLFLRTLFGLGQLRLTVTCSRLRLGDGEVEAKI